MRNIVYTAGYAGWTPAQLLSEAERLNAKVVDIRMRPTSTRPEWAANQLRDVLGAAHYTHMPEFGNKNYANGGPIEIANPAAGLLKVWSTLQRRCVILLCGCQNVLTCHRHVVAELIRSEFDSAVIHLDPPVMIAPGAIKAISVTAPWGTLIALGLKRIETRSWRTSYRGPLAIHQAKSLAPVGGKRGLRELIEREPFRTALCNISVNGQIDWWGKDIVEQLPLGQVLCIRELVDCVETNPGSDQWAIEPYRLFEYGNDAWRMPPTEPEASFGNYSLGRWGWLLGDGPTFDTPIPATGKQGLWDWVPPEGVL